MAATTRARKTPAKKAVTKKPAVIDETGADVGTDFSDEIEMKSVIWRGETFTFPAQVEDWPAETLEGFEKNRAMSAMHELLGDEQYERLLNASRRRSVREVAEVMDLVGQEMGFEGSGE